MSKTAMERLNKRRTEAMNELLGKYSWNLFFGFFPNFEDGLTYRIYKSHSSDQNELLGAGATADEAIAAALAYTPTSNQKGETA